MTDASPPFPFRFYGADPADWYEGANDGHLYELAFKNAPDTRALTTIAEHFERELARGAASPARTPWEWSGRWAFFFVGERVPGRGKACFASVAKMLRAIDASVQLEQVVFWGTRNAGADAWTKWSLSQGRPACGPAHPKLVAGHYFRKGRDETLPAPTANDAFEQARSDARASRLRRRSE